jgi:membrane protein YdbS with pleckstrin-like domain
MYDRSSSLVLRWLKVPPEPHAPIGDPASLRVFRAGKNFFNLKLVGWAIGQVFALAGIIFWIVVFVQVEDGVRLERARRAALPPPAVAPAPSTMQETIRSTAKSAVTELVEEPKPGDTPAKSAAKKPPRKRVRAGDWNGFIRALVQVAVVLPPWAFLVLWGVKISGILLYLAQIPFTYAIMRLDFEMRWYVVTDRSLRIRTGVWNVQELTMSFANLQQVVVAQGPLQRLLGLADVHVRSAGGGGGENPHQQARGESLHAGNFHCVENAHEIRDLILARLRLFRESGLGDPEEARRAPAVPAPTASAAPADGDADVLAAARELAAEAKALRQALG